MKIAIAVILTLVAGISVGYIVAPKRNTAYEGLLQAEILKAQEEAKASKVKEIKALQLAEAYANLKRQYQDSAAIERRQKIYFKNKYASISRTPAPQYSESDLDSLISAIIE